MGNPFTEDSGDLLALDTKNVMDANVVRRMRGIKSTGQREYKNFVDQRLLSHEKTISDTIKRINSVLFSDVSSLKRKSKDKQDLAIMKNDFSLFSRLYISCQTREGNLDDFFKHENLAYPPSLSHGGKLRVTSKSDLLSCLYTCAKPSSTAPNTDAMVIDGAALVHLLPPSKYTN